MSVEFQQRSLGKLPLLAGFVALLSVYLVFESVREVRFLVSGREALAEVTSLEPRKLRRAASGTGSSDEVLVYDVAIRLKDPLAEGVRVEHVRIDSLDRLEPLHMNWPGAERMKSGAQIPNSVRAVRVEFVPGAESMVQLVGERRLWTVYLLAGSLAVLAGLIVAGLWRFRHVERVPTA